MARRILCAQVPLTQSTRLPSWVRWFCCVEYIKSCIFPTPRPHHFQTFQKGPGPERKRKQTPPTRKNKKTRHGDQEITRGDSHNSNRMCQFNFLIYSCGHHSFRKMHNCDRIRCAGRRNALQTVDGLCLPCKRKEQKRKLREVRVARESRETNTWRSGASCHHGKIKICNAAASIEI